MQVSWPRAVLAAALALGVGLAVLGGPERRAAWALRNRPGITSPAVDPWVRQAVTCLERFGARSFSVEGRLASEYGTYQPIVVAAWPIEVSRRAPLRVVAADELGALGCRPAALCRAGEAAVVACAP